MNKFFVIAEFDFQNGGCSATVAATCSLWKNEFACYCVEAPTARGLKVPTRIFQFSVFCRFFLGTVLLGSRVCVCVCVF